MSAAPHLALTPIIVFGDTGVSFDALQRIMSNANAFASKAPSLLDAFQVLVNKERGIMFVRMEDRQTFVDFAKTFQISIRQLIISQIKIIICSNSDEFSNSRALTQFPFIKTIKPIDDVKGLATILLGEAQFLNEKGQKKRSQQGGLSSKIIIIKGGQNPQNKQAPIIQERTSDRGHTIIHGEPKNSDDWLPVPNSLNKSNQTETPAPPEANLELLDKRIWTNFDEAEGKDGVLPKCLGANIPTFIYNNGLSWRVRGFFKEYDSENNVMTFQCAHLTGAEKLRDEVSKANSIFYSSTSIPRARVCSSLGFIEQKGLEFKFKTPDKIQGVQRRANERARISADFPVIIQYFDERLGADRTLNVIDISTGGMGIRLDKDFVQDFEVGRRIQNISLFFFNRVIRINDFEVRHCSRSDVNPDFKILGVMMSGITQTDLNFVEMFVLSETKDTP